MTLEPFKVYLNLATYKFKLFTNKGSHYFPKNCKKSFFVCFLHCDRHCKSLQTLELFLLIIFFFFTFTHVSYTNIENILSVFL